MTKATELAQLGGLVNVTGSGTATKVGIGTTVDIDGGLAIKGTPIISNTGVWQGSTAGIQGAQGTSGVQGTTGPVAGSANQVVYKNNSNTVTGNANFLFLNDSTLIVGAAASTGTASQPLQVTGGAYVSGNLGIGTTNATSKLQVVGDTRVSGIVTALDFYNDAEYPNVRPTLDLAFAETKILDSRITFTRASTGTFVGSNGLLQTAASGAARFDHNPATGESLGLLVEEARTNTFTYSEQFDNAIWTKTNATVTANAIAAPDGTTTSDTFVESTDGVNTFHKVHQANATTNGTSYTFSVFAKYISRQWIMITGNRDGWHSYFDIQNGVIGNKGNLVSSQSIQRLANGWYKCSATIVADATLGGVAFEIASSTTNGTDRVPSYVGAGQNCFYLWGAQVEVGAFPTSYIPTTTATVTRAADVASMTGTNFSSWYNSSKGGGTVFSKYRNPLTGTTAPGHIWSFDGGGVRWLAYWGPFQLYDGTAGFGLSPSNLLTSPVSEAVALEAVSSGVNQESVARNGIVTSGGGPGQIIGLNTLSIGYSTNVSSYLNGTIARLAYYPVRLPDAQLQTITL